MLSTFLRTLSTLIFLCALAGCGGGGGGGGDDDASGTETAVTPTGPGGGTAIPTYSQVSGKAVKGVIGKATISAYTLNPDGSRGALLGVTQSTDDGSYTLDILAQTTPVWVELTGNSSAFMVCDSLEGCGESSGESTGDEQDSNSNGQIDFGEKMSLSSGFMLRALLPDATEGQVSATISPLTHLAAVLTEMFPQGIDGLSIAMANSQVANLFALDTDILATQVPDVTNTTGMQTASAQERKYALILGAFAALSEDGDFTALLQQTATTFANLEGQLPARASEDGEISLQDWAEKAMALAAHFEDADLNAAFAALKMAAEAAEGESTHAAPDSNLTSSELKTAIALISQVHGLKGTIDITQPSDPLPAFSPLMTGSDQISQSTDALTQAGRFGAYVAVPKMALEAACNSISNFLTAYLCRSVVAKKSLEEICTMTLSNLSIGGKTLCEYLNALRLPIGNGLIAELALMDGIASVEGEYDGTTVDMLLQHGTTNNSDSVSMEWSGSAENDDFAFAMSGGNISFQFDDLASLSSLNHPRAIDSSFTALVSFKSDQVSRFEGDAKTSVSLADEDNPVTNTQLKGVFTDSVGQASTINLALTLQSSFGAIMSAAFPHPVSGDSLALTLAHSASGSTIRMQWSGNTVNMITEASPQTVILNNGGLVTLSLSTQQTEGNVGKMTYNRKPYGDIYWEASELLVKLPNGQTAVLF